MYKTECIILVTFSSAEDPAGRKSNSAAAEQERPHEADRTDGVRGAAGPEEAQDRGHPAGGYACTGSHACSQKTQV